MIANFLQMGIVLKIIELCGFTGVFLSLVNVIGKNGEVLKKFISLQNHIFSQILDL